MQKIEDQKNTTALVLKIVPFSASFSFIVSLFKQTLQILEQINVKQCPSSIWHWGLNSRPSRVNH